MTAIAGFVDGGRVYVGGDSCAGTAQGTRRRGDPKVFTIGGGEGEEALAVGCTTSFRMTQVIRYQVKVPPRHPAVKDDVRWLSVDFVNELRRAFKEAGYAMTYARDGYAGSEAGGEFLVGYRGGLYAVHADYQVAHFPDGIAACGCGEEYALGALAVSELRGEARVLQALAVAERFSAFVRGPFAVVSV